MITVFFVSYEGCLLVCMFAFDDSPFHGHLAGTAKVRSQPVSIFVLVDSPTLRQTIVRCHDVVVMALDATCRTTGWTLERSARCFWRACGRPW